jgi:NitT/TauT family transport system permease protein
MKATKYTNLVSLIILVIILSGWQIFSMGAKFNFLFGSPASVFSKILEGTISGVLPYNFVVTGLEALAGFFIGIILGTFVGFLLWYSPKIAVVSKPYLSFLGAIPAFAFAPMIIIWFGIGFTMKVALASFAVFLVALAQAYEGAKSVDEAEYKLLKTYGATRFQIFQKVIFPASISWVLASMKLSVGFAILGAFVGEFISSNEGLGHFMLKAGSLYDIPGVLAGGLYLVLLSVIFSRFVKVIEKNRMKIIEALS